jgi:hypothetical protein
MSIKPDTVLQRMPELRLEVDSAHQVRLHHQGRVLEFGPYALTLLDVFYQPITVAEALRRVAPRLGPGRAMSELITTLAALVQAGALVTTAPAGFTDLMFPTGGYGLAFLNIAILDDPVRKRTFIEAIDEVVRPGDIVLDLGTGSGVLAVAAARAGAQHVYAIEPARSGDLAARVAEHNGYADRITFIRGWSSTLELPQRATVLTTDIVGNDALDMVIWEAVQDARERLLTPDARLVPSRFDAVLYLVDIPAEDLGRHRMQPAHVQRWRSWYGMDFTPMLDADRDRVAGFYERPEVVQRWQRMSEPAPAFTVDLHDPVRVFANDVTLTASTDGTVTGAVLFFTAQLGPTTSLCTAPWEGSDRSHWYTAGWAFPEPRKVTVGDRLHLRYRYEGDGRSRVDLLPDHENGEDR